MVATGNQINYLVGVKEECQIKEEPQSVDDMVDIPMSNYRHLEYSIGVDQSNGDYDFESLNCDDVKNGAKEEVDKKKEDKSKSNAHSGKDVMENQSNDQQSAPPQAQGEDDFTSPESSHDV